MWLSFTFALLSTTWGFPGGSDGKEAACNFPYAQLVKNLPAILVKAYLPSLIMPSHLLCS